SAASTSTCSSTSSHFSEFSMSDSNPSCSTQFRHNPRPTRTGDPHCSHGVTSARLCAKCGSLQPVEVDWYRACCRSCANCPQFSVEDGIHRCAGVCLLSV